MNVYLGVIMVSKSKISNKIATPPIMNSIYQDSSSQKIIERQMISYMNIFKNIADQISDLNCRFIDVQDAAE